ncbi:hypothetical protein HRI_002041900 [Hibiscus trionum]|uniref:Retrovirus-related Pol polyprotein from transposon TNT 1-94-like beta-barrel domain-containing protein n=1 Tax=Hibiscus trionum TaxID=183268 RepID=A0A9W7HV97_HIBTR|nr:hypothetical protein HRI_002041900 [Hibiscus trionum]
MHGVAFALTESLSPTASEKQIECWIHANKICRHTIISTLSNELFDAYCPYKKSKEIWDNMILNYTAEDVGKQKFIIEKFYRWEMTEDVEVKVQINKYHKLLEDLKSENITLPEEFVAGLLIEKLPPSWNDYKQQLKHKQLSLKELITHIIIEKTNRNEVMNADKREFTTRANLIEKPGHYAHQCRHRKGIHENPTQSNVNLVEADEIIAAFLFQANIVTNMIEWVVDSGVTRHICDNRNVFTSYTPVKEGEESVYLGDFRTTSLLGKGKVMLKLTSGKTLTLSDVFYVPNI